MGCTSAPAFDLSTDWPVEAESLVDPSALDAGAKSHFVSAYVTHGTLVAGMGENVTVPLHAVISGAAITIRIHDAIITFDHVNPDEAAHGILAGVLDRNEFADAFMNAVAQANPALCGAARRRTPPKRR